ncbi:carbon-phosphorus lyase complex subunit PhnI [Sulfurospirillum sp. 1307]|jgi:alpha-D-ribose 1-methylphosphonate 5-triphosphate synthase subunit PhnI
MGYVAIKGGEEAIKNSLAFYDDTFKYKIKPKDIEKSLSFAVDKVMSEGSLYSKKLSAIAIQKSGGDLLNAAFFLRAHRSSCARVGIAKVINTDDMRVTRRISSAFKDIKGGQILGPSNDYEVKLILKKASNKTLWSMYSDEDVFVESALKPLRDQNLVKTLKKDEVTSDITRVFPAPPYPRSAVMQIMSRGEGGSMLGFAYTTMRGYGDVHPTIGDLRIGTCDVKFTHPFTKKEVKICEIEATSCEVAATFEKQEDGSTKLSTGYGFCFGVNETKAISMAILDTSLYNSAHTIGEGSIADNFEMIVHHIDGIESMGFTNHYKLPHYVTFQADLQVFSNAQKHSKGEN